MNIFYLSNDPKQIAIWQMDRHCIKMPLETVQLLCTAHRILDGKEKVIKYNGRNKKIWEISDDRNDILYTATHVSHPSAIWTRNSDSNYLWLYQLCVELLKEYTYRYGKIHACERLLPYLKNSPKNILKGKFTEPTQAMPDIFKVKNDSIMAYRQYYIGSKQHLAKWNGKINSRNVPEWYVMK